MGKKEGERERERDRKRGRKRERLLRDSLGRARDVHSSYLFELDYPQCPGAREVGQQTGT